ncbi:MAG: ADP-ribosyltransferase [Oligoflexales bacterium]
MRLSTFLLFLALSSTSCKSISNDAKVKDSDEIEKPVTKHPANMVQGTIKDIVCANDVASERLKESCYLELEQEGGLVVRLVSDDVAHIRGDKRNDLVGGRLAVYPELVERFKNEADLKALEARFGPGSYVSFYGDVPWLCHNLGKIVFPEKCGLRFPYDYDAEPALRKAAMADIMDGNTIVFSGYSAPNGDTMAPDEYVPYITAQESSGVLHYTQGDYGTLNDALWGKDETQLDKYMPYIAVITSALRKLQKFEGTVYRGFDYKESRVDPFTDAFNNDEPIQQLGFTSTSYVKGTEFERAVKLVIHSYSAAIIDNLSDISEEKEALFAPGTWFRVTGIKDGEQFNEGQELDQYKNHVQIELTELVIIE